MSIDADLQDDPFAIVDMARQFVEGKDIVYGVRRERKTDIMVQARLGTRLLPSHACRR